jgi:methyltransferase family protein
MDRDKLSEEIGSFEGIWEDGYFEGDPLDPLGKSTYGSYGFMSVLHATYLRCIKPYIRSETVALEIGPGRGAWTKTMLGAKEVWALDALSAEHNRFFEYLNFAENARYFKVDNFECSDLPDEHFDYMFSFGCLCHVSFDGISAYAKNTFPKMVPGANCFWMIADKEKYRSLINSKEHFDIWRGLAPKRSKLVAIRKVFEAISSFAKPAFTKHNDFAEGKGQWYDAGLERTCQMLEKTGYKIVDRDVGTIPRDPIIHFMKP